MPDRSNKLKRLNKEAGEYELPYISKSRIKQWLTNKEHFRLKYLEGIAEPETGAMVRGTRIHEAFEEFYHAAHEKDAYPGIDGLPENRQLWADFMDPYVTNFLRWEKERWDTAGRRPAEYLPRGIEEECWRDGVLELPAEPEWMGLADAVLPAASLPAVPEDTGSVIVDFKTGSVPDEQYRGDGIYTELEYYAMLFEDEYDVVAVGAYYPKEDTFLTQPAGVEEQRSMVLSAAEELVTACRDYDGDVKFETNEGPLCRWSFDDDDESPYYGVCSQCTWAKPANNKETFKAMLDEGYSFDRIAEELGCSTDSVSYWKYKLENE